MAQNVTFNKLGNLSFSGNDAIYRIPTEHLLSDDPKTIERGIKRLAVGSTLEHQLLTPIEVFNEGRYSILKYDLNQLHAFDKLIEFSLQEKLDYFRSLVAIASEEKRKGIRVTWEKSNFVVDTHERNIKVLLYETDTLPIFSDNDIKVVQRVKELMLISLTKLNHIISLPKLVDLLEQDSINRDFCQSLYHYDNLEDILYLIEETELKYLEEGKEGEEDDEEEVPKRKLFAKKKKDKDVVKKPKKQKKTPYTPPNRGKKKVSRFDKKTVMMMVACLFVLLLYLGTELMTGSDKDSKSEFQEVTKTTNTATSTYFKSSDNKAITNALIRAYRASYSGRPKDAYTILETINMRDLDVSDLSMVIAVYDSENALAALLDANPIPEFSNEVITYLIKKDELNKLSDVSAQMKTANPYIEFETAYLDADYKKVIELKDMVELNGRKEGQIVDSYLQLGKIQEATEFAQTVGNPDLFKQIDGYTTF